MAKLFSDEIQDILNTKWSFSNNYDFQFDFTDTMKRHVNWLDETDGRNINQHIVNSDTPDWTNDPIETYVGGQFRIHNGKDQLYRFSVTFRDSDSMNLYRKFVNMYRLQKSLYFDDFKMSVIITKADDYNYTNGINLMRLEDTMIEGVSNLAINNTSDAQVAEFTVRFKSMSPNVLPLAQ